ncbi:MAG: sulfate permease [Betaproteobacteria bacterium]|nr:sulfate permease [Betaproteobacteria bacterium]
MSWKPALPRLPILQWRRELKGQALVDDALAGVIVAVMIIPQSLAYALLAGLPPQAGLYASIVPTVLYALMGSSRVLAVGPVAVVSLMTAAAVGEFAQAHTAHYAEVALALALLSGLMLTVMGLLRLGFIANFLSHPVISGFVTASGLLIAASQLKTLLGVQAGGHNLPEMLAGVFAKWDQVQSLTMAVGLGTLLFLFAVRSRLKLTLRGLGLSPRAADLLSKLGPVAAIVVTTAAAAAFDWQGQGLKTVGHIPPGLPPFTLPSWDLALWGELALPALLISIVGFVESVSVGQSLAAKRRQRVDPDQELVALGAANIGAAFTGGFPVTGGFSRSVVNFDAGARTQLASVITAAGILLATLVLTPALLHLPQATLAAIIVVAVLTLVDFPILSRTWRYSRPDFLALVVTLVLTLLLGVEVGLVAGVTMSVALYLLRTSQPHIAEVGLVPGTEHFRNVRRHQVLTAPHMVSLRVDESLYFANARAIEDRINDTVARQPALRHVVLQCSAINDIDASALESLEAIDGRLRDAGLCLHLSEVKGPVMDRLERSDLLKHLSGRVFLTHYQALQQLAPELAGAALAEPPSQTPPTA